MSYHFGPQIIPQGLVFYYDPGNPESFNPNPGFSASIYNIGPGYISGSTKTNYSGSINYSLPNTASFSFEQNKSLYLPSSSYSGSGANSVYTYLIEDGMKQNIIAGATDLTISIWFKSINPGTGGRLGLLFGAVNQPSSDNQVVIFVGPNSVGSFISGSNTSTGTRVPSSPTNSYTKDQWGNAVLTISSLVCTMYCNGRGGTPETLTGPLPTADTDYKQIRIGGSWAGPNVATFQGYIGPIAIYNRGLSASEVAYNYSRMKQRFANL
jgi:hypothetical protein